MTTDERLNELEDKITKLKEAINHNNGVHRKVVAGLETKIKDLNTRIDTMKTQDPMVGFGDIFSGVKR
jgi:hypothetical protein